MSRFATVGLMLCGLAGLACAADAAPPDGSATPTPTVAQIAAREFVIFFEHGGGWIPDDAAAVLPQIAEIFGRVGYATVTITCHSDNVGTQELNIKLTQDRARRIKSELVRYGVPDATITAVGLGYSDPLVPDAAADIAVSNRRCEIVLG